MVRDDGFDDILFKMFGKKIRNNEPVCALRPHVLSCSAITPLLMGACPQIDKQPASHSFLSAVKSQLMNPVPLRDTWTAPDIFLIFLRPFIHRTRIAAFYPPSTRIIARYH